MIVAKWSQFLIYFSVSISVTSYSNPELTSKDDHFGVKIVILDDLGCFASVLGKSVAACFDPLQHDWLSDGTDFDLWPPFCEIDYLIFRFCWVIITVDFVAYSLRAALTFFMVTIIHWLSHSGIEVLLAAASWSAMIKKWLFYNHKISIWKTSSFFKG